MAKSTSGRSPQSPRSKRERRGIAIPEGVDLGKVDALLDKWDAGKHHSRHSDTWKVNRAVAFARNDVSQQVERLKAAGIVGEDGQTLTREGERRIADLGTVGHVAMEFGLSAGPGSVARLLVGAVAHDRGHTELLTDRGSLYKGESAYGPMGSTGKPPLFK